jgi:hypothetical protein
MATPQLSPGIITREIDLTTGAVGNVSGVTAGFAAPFNRGPVEEPIVVTNENDLLNNFGSGVTTDRHYEYWLSASSFLSYGGDLLVARCNSSHLKNSSVGLGVTPSIKIKNFDDYNLNFDGDPSLDFIFAAKNPGTWADGLKVAIIDDFADQTISIGVTNPSALGIEKGVALKKDLTNLVVPGVGVTSLFNGYLKAIVTDVHPVTTGNATVDIKLVSKVADAVTSYSTVSTTTLASTGAAGTTRLYLTSTSGILDSDEFTGGGLTRDSIVSVASTYIDITTGLASTITSGTAILVERSSYTPEVETPIEYGEGSDLTSFKALDTVGIATTAGLTGTTVSLISAIDWYNQQTISLANQRIFWKNIAPKPKTNSYVSSRGGKNDAIHVALFDDSGSITGIQGNLLEKWLGLSKSADAVSTLSSPSKIYYKKALATFSNYIYAGTDPSGQNDALNGTSPSATGFSSGYDPIDIASGVWGQNAANITFNSVGNVLYTLSNGYNYENNGMQVSLGDISSAYDVFEDDARFSIDYLIQGPGLTTEQESQAKANKLIAIAEQRKDCIAVISPHRENVVDISNSTTQTTNVINFFNQITSSSYAVFDSGYKLMYDRFNNNFSYIPCNADVAGLMVRTTLNQFPWFSPAGLQRGSINNAVRLAYNPTKAQRDLLYTARVNPIINQPGTGFVLFGDKTALSFVSAFDRINVRKLFLYIERSINSLAEAQLFQFNDEITRTSFVSLVEPFLRDIQSKRGVFDFLVRCDESNNTPDVIDNNEFRADIFIKPTRSINYVTLTFVATRTGASFSEYTG